MRDRDLEAEWSVVGSMLIDPRCIGGVVAGLTGDDFRDPSCRNAYGVVRDLFLAGEKVDPVIVLNRLGGGSERVDWMRQVMELTPTAANVAEYVGIVRRNTALERLRGKAALLSEAQDLDAAVAIVRELSGMISETGRGRTVTAVELATGFIERLKAKEKPEYLPWGIPSLDRLTYGELGDYVVLGGYPSAGKTLLSLQMALCQARRRRVVYYELETQPEKMADRLFAHLTPLPLPAIKEHTLSAEQHGKAAIAANHFVTNCPVTFVQAAGFTAEDVAADAISKGAEIVYIDYLQLLEGGGDRDSDYQRVTRVSRSLKVFGQVHKITVVALAQLSRPEKTGKGDTKKQVPPNMHSLRESGQIEQDADIVFLLWVEDENNNDASRRKLKIGKNKEGRRKTIDLDFQGQIQTMTELEQEPDRSAAARYIADGKAIKDANRMKSMQMRLDEGTDENPFLKK